MDRSKTVDRSIRLLFELADNPRGLTVTDLAGRLGTERPPLYRVLRTLSDYKLITRDTDKRYTLSIGILALVRAFNAPFVDRARVELQGAADEAGHTALLHLADGDTLVVALCVVPRTPGVHLTVQLGTPYTYHDGAPWTVIYSAREPGEQDSAAIREARELGFAESYGRIRPGVGGISVPLRMPNREGSLSLVGSGEIEDRDRVVAIAQRAAQSLSAIASD
jgi:DNA-binding IclR family transcriptional regulator